MFGVAVGGGFGVADAFGVADGGAGVVGTFVGAGVLVGPLVGVNVGGLVGAGVILGGGCGVLVGGGCVANVILPSLPGPVPGPLVPSGLQEMFSSELLNALLATPRDVSVSPPTPLKSR